MWPAQVRSLDPVHKPQWTVAAGFITWGDSQAVSLPGSCVENHSRRQSWAWWYNPAMPAPGEWRQENQEFRHSMGYIVSLRSVWLNETLSQKWN